MAERKNDTNVTLTEVDVATETISEDNEDWFVQKSCCVDEVILQFDDDKELYVSASFLIYASPVFKAMLTSDFEEKKSKTIQLTRKRYDDMLTFLKCMHPGILLNITSSNVAIIAPLAEEYQVDKIIAKCKEVMTIWLRRGYDFQEQNLLVKVPERHPHSPESQPVVINHEPQFNFGPLPTSGRGLSKKIVSQSIPQINRFQKDVNICLKVLYIALQLNYTNIETEAVSILSGIPFKYTSGECTEPTQDAAVVSENQEMFKTLPQALQLDICQKRLRVCDK